MSKLKNNDYAARFKAIRKYINKDEFFNDKSKANLNNIKKGVLTASDKRKITQYYEEVSEFLGQPRYFYKPRNKKREKLSKEYVGQSNKKYFKGVFLPAAPDGKKPKLNFKDDELEIGYENVKSTFLPFDKDGLLNDTTNEVIKTMNSAPKGTSHFGIQVGKHESIRHTVDANAPELMTEKINSWMTQYKEKKPHEWINGLIAHKTKNQASIDEYTEAKRKAREQYKRNRK